MGEFLQRLKDRKLVQWALAYLAAAFALIQVLDIISTRFGWPESAIRYVIIALAIGLFIALVLAWYHGEKGAQRASGIELLILALLLAIGGAALWYLAPANSRSGAIALVPAAPHVAPPKSIAVLPFANLSEEKANEFFAGGIQDEILTRLAKIGALKVISRTSTQHYASSPDNLAEIARQLDVANILEGSVQKAGNAVHINVQLIRTATDEHLWAESYNRTLDDVFGVEGEVAQAVAEALNAKLSTTEQQTIAAKPTQNAQAYEAWLRGRAIGGVKNSYDSGALVLDADLDAVRLDPNFAEAWADAAITMSFLYWNVSDLGRSTPQAIRNAVDNARRLRPDMGEGVLAQGFYKYRVERDYVGAVEDFRVAAEKLPNDPGVPLALFYVERRMGRFEEAITDGRRAIRLDPHNVDTLASIGGETVFYLRHPGEARELLKQALQMSPNDETSLAGLATIDQVQGRLDSAEQWLARKALDVRDLPGITRITQLWLRRRFGDMERLIEPSLPADDSKLTGVDLYDLVFLGHAQQRAGHADAARLSFERTVRVYTQRPDVAEHTATAGYENLALAYAGLGDHAEALKTAQKAIEHYRNDAYAKPGAELALAQIYAMHGDNDAAIALVPSLLEGRMSGLTPELLALDPFWDKIRDDPRFKALAKEPALP